MAATRLTVITPTVGRPSLWHLFESLAGQLSAGDEWIVVGDGPQQTVRRTTPQWDARTAATVRYLETGLTREWGYVQREYGVERATGDYLWFMDDDDVAAPDAVRTIKDAISDNPGKLFMFRMDTSGYNAPKLPPLLWEEQGRLDIGTIGTPMFVCPNRDGYVGSWLSGLPKCRDWQFINRTIKRYPDGSLVWRPEIVCICRPPKVGDGNSNQDAHGSGRRILERQGR